MFNATPYFKLYSRRRAKVLEKQNPASTQESVLRALLAQAQNTRFGKEYGFSEIKSVEDFQKRVPLRRYEDFWEEYWKKDFPKLENCTWPGQVPYFCVSSGTSSGTTKYIPCTKEMLASNTKAGMDLLVHHVTNKTDSQILGGRNFMLGGSCSLKEEATGIYSGDLSGITVEELPVWARPWYFPPKRLALMSDWEEKIEVLSHESLNANIRMLGGVPAWLLIFFDKLSSLVPGNPKQLKDIYPKLEMLVYGGVNFSPYQEQFEEWVKNSSIDLREVYPASEGFLAIADRLPGQGLRMNLDHNIFYEFVPLEELDAPQPTRHWVGNIEKDINYAVIMSTCAGLWSYIIGDTVRFVDTRPARVLVTGRTSYYLSAFGEHLIAEEIEKSVSGAAEKLELSVVDYSVGAVFPDKNEKLGGHRYFIESATEREAGGLRAQFAQLIDERLCELNEDYAAHRSEGFGLKDPEIILVQKGSFRDWMQARGKLGGQNKVPRIINDAELFAHLQDFMKDRALKNDS